MYVPQTMDTIINRKYAQYLYVLNGKGKEVRLCRRLTLSRAEEIRQKTKNFCDAYRKAIEWDAWLRYVYDDLHAGLHERFPTKLPHVIFKRVSRQVSNLIHDGPKFPTGWISVEALKLQKKSRTKEHFRARQRACETLVMEIYDNRGITYERFKERVEFFCWVHYTTPEQNNKLSAYQNDPNGPQDWESQYEMAGVELVYRDHLRFRNYWEQ